ncbi:hypothetical protein HHK36_012343 [Tetracentron sinense]|uniref:Uncharacterized protein n=1 Tax=Tetracentron sinense TaxID=13715 RepID=A0A835DIK2_TETSI|nr:hypothetical protein HHK36_012343 [Tetracentron sinense]
MDPKMVWGFRGVLKGLAEALGFKSTWMADGGRLMAPWLMAGIGGFARDLRRRILGGFVQALRSGSPIVAVCSALNFAKSQVWRKVLVLTDALSLVEFIVGFELAAHWEVQVVVDDIQVVLW